jgi:CHAT domain-containing protein
LYNESLKAKSSKIITGKTDSIYLQLSEQRWSGELANELKKMFRGRYYLGESANISAFRKSFSEQGIIHIAAHTLFNDDDAMNSRIVFAKEIAGDTLKQDAYLYAYDLVGTNAKASLVVLASCRTGFGTFRRCDGISGISMGFSYAGCPSLIFTLWEVDEKATNQLLLSFYNALQKGVSIDRSLQQAQLNYLETANEIGADPYYWAGLLASGDCRPFTFQAERRFLPKTLILGSAILFIAISFSIFIIFRRRQGTKSKRFV